MDGLVREPSIRYILALQEAVAISMADGYAQASGKLGVVNVHTSPGLGNAMGMLYDAHEAGTPLLVTAGQHDQAMNLTEPILWSDLPPVARPYVKWSHEITRLEDLPRAVRRAVKTAMAHPTGPVFISLPVDVLNAERELDLLQSTRVAPRIRGDRAAIEAAADLLVKATRPILISGDAVAHGDALAEMAAARGGARRAGLHRVRALHLLLPVHAPALPRPVPAPGPAHPPAPDAARPAVLGGRRSLHALAAVGRRADAGRAAADPPRPRPLGDRQELSGPGGDPGRSEGHAARARGGPAPAADRLAGQGRERARGEAAGRAGGAPRSAAPGSGRPGEPPPDQPARARGRGRGRGARRGHHRGRDHLLEPRRARAAARPRPPRLLRPARRRHRLGPARLARREAGPARPPGDRAGGRRQRHVHDPVALDGRARLHRGRLRDLQQPVLPHPQAAHPGAQGLLGRGQRVRGDGPGEAGARLRGAREGAGRAGRDGGEGGRRRHRDQARDGLGRARTWWTSASTARSAPERGRPARPRGRVRHAARDVRAATPLRCARPRVYRHLRMPARVRRPRNTRRFERSQR